MGKALLVLVLSASLAVQGCAGLVSAVRETPERAQEFVKDPVRVKNLSGRVLEGLAGGVAAGLCWLIMGPFGLLCAPLGEFLAYEYALEPLGLGGPYWERGPRLPVLSAAGDVVESGQVYREFTEAECAFYRATWHPNPSLPSGGWCESG